MYRFRTLGGAVLEGENGPLSGRSSLRLRLALLALLAASRDRGVPRDKLLEGLLVDGELKMKAIIHRDGDFMTEEEAARWKGTYNTDGVFPWVTAGSDMEGYFCTAPYLAALYGISLGEAEDWRRSAAQNVGDARNTFLSKRKAIVRAVWPNGGSPDAEAMWEVAGGRGPTTVKGKKLLAQLKVVVKQCGHNEKLLDTYAIPKNYVVASDLKATLEAALCAH